jgi:M6 family metalloprotease-like protein
MMARAVLALAIAFLILPLLPGSELPLGQDLSAQALNRQPPPGLLERLDDRAQLSSFSRGWKARTAQAMASSEALTGTMPVAIILALFSDSPEPHLGAPEVQQAMFDGPSQYGTVSEYYQEVSGGRFSVTGQAFPWIRTHITRAEVVGTEYGLGDDDRTGEYLLEAVAVADSTVDFGLFDNDGPDGVPNSGDDDGVVDAVAFQYLEIAASCGGPSIWPHRWVLEGWTEDEEPFQTNDLGPDGTPIVVSDYTTQGATDCGGIEVQNATTIAHELGHVLGLPDLYDRSQGVEPEHRRWIVGCWDLMAAGAWGCGTDNRNGWVRPTHMGAWEKEVLGWVDQVEDVGSVLDGTFTLEPVMSGQRILKVSLEPDAPEEEMEYLLLEYRTQEGFDADIPASGVLIYHVDPELPGNRPCDTCPQQYRVALMEADGNNSLRRNFQRGGNRGEAGDAWGAFGDGVLTHNTYPSTSLNSGDRSSVTIHRIALENGVALINLSSRAFSSESLLHDFLDTSSQPLTSEEREYLDSQGNGNGVYDVGDLRAFLQR